jgi:hypothetical protein
MGGPTMSEMESVVAVEEIETAELSPRKRHANRMLFIGWVNARPGERSSLDVLGSVMLYDAEKYFVAAAEELPDEDALRQLHAGTKVRYWSRGI